MLRRESQERASETIDQLRLENEALRRELQQFRGASHPPHHSRIGWRPSRTTVMGLSLAGVLLFALVFLAGYLPFRSRTSAIAAEAEERETAAPRVEVITVKQAAASSGLQLPGNIQGLTEASLLARADGYVKRRIADIGDHVRAGQTLAVIEAPELDDQVRQAQAAADQTRAAIAQAEANLQQGRSDLELARVSAKRFAALVGDGSVSAQENDQYQAQYKSKLASVRSLEQALGVQNSSRAAAEANVARLENMKGYKVVTAPFTGIITARNVDTGALVNSGNTVLYRMAEASTVRIFLNVPQTHASAVSHGNSARVNVSNLPGRVFTGSVARTANALDPATRTLLVEVHVPNADGALLPGMYAQVELSASRENAPLLIPSTALVVSSAGTRVAVVREGNRIHLQPIVPGRDYGDRIEIMSGLAPGSIVVASPSDVMREGTVVDPVPVSLAAKT